MLYFLGLCSTPGGQRPAPANSTSSSIHEFFIRSSLEAAANAPSSGTGGTALETTASSSSNSYFCHLSSLTSVEESSRRPAAHRIFRALMDNKRLRGLMPNLLASLSDDCLTPFMLAVQCKAYQVAAYILDFLIVRFYFRTNSFIVCYLNMKSEHDLVLVLGRGEVYALVS